MSERVGIVGIGLMGSAISGNLLDAGYEVQGFDLDGKRVDEFVERGGISAESPSAAADGVNWLITSLPTSDIVREVIFGNNGIMESAKEGLILADATTSRPEDSERLGKELAEKGIRFLDAAVSGTSAMAWKKDLIIIAGGEQEDFDACKPNFDGFKSDFDPKTYFEKINHHDHHDYDPFGRSGGPKWTNLPLYWPSRTKFN